ncbi:A disintegrin and metalloproteinase with thrombospondin motifs adt-2-like [Watersipora subatra]|uniref:A disintegrin and metalloproteinase with thrombospondin motifs adt-2-like n=1 Tax=Watersipora subatra TaxID=2589382 RepID=UPI00355C8BAC
MCRQYLVSLGVVLLALECCYGQNWNAWGNWAACTASCGTGTTSRTRECAGPAICTGHTAETGSCHHAVPCEWGEWGPYGSCSTSCGPGVLTRFRNCENGNITSNTCVGSSNSTTPCNVRECPQWAAWGHWSACSVSCGPGAVITRARVCNGNGECAGNSTETGSCSPAFLECPGVWTQWVGLPCSKTCGPGTQIRTRTCPAPGRCNGDSQDAILCNEQVCPGTGDAGQWSEWSTWSACSETCGRRGRVSRVRTCNSETCVGDTVEEARCGRQPRCRRRRRRRNCRRGRRCRNRAQA